MGQGYKDTSFNRDTGRRTEIRDADYVIRGSVEVEGDLTKNGSAVGGSSLSKATGAEVNTGTDDAKYVTSKAVADSDVVVSSRIVDNGTDVTIDPPQDGNFTVTTLGTGAVNLIASGDISLDGDNTNVEGRSSIFIYIPNSGPSISLDSLSGAMVLLAASGVTIVPPTADPHIVGALWNNAGTLTISAG